MKCVQIVRGVVHVPTAFFAPTIETIAALPVPSGDRSVRVVQRGQTVTLTDAEADRLIERRVAVEVTPVAPVAINADLDPGAIEIHGVDVQADGYVVSRLNRGEVK
jgi:hypothetical protein